MLNRRILRVKAMQTLYAFQQCKEANFENAIDKIKSNFQPDLNSMEVQDKAKLGEESMEAIELFQKNHKSDRFMVGDTSSTKIRKVALEATQAYKREVQKDADYLKRRILQETEYLYNHYLLILKLFVDFADYIENDFVKKQNTTIIEVAVFEHQRKFCFNHVVKHLKKHEALNKEFSIRNLRWSPIMISDWCRLLVKTEKFAKYQDLAETNQEIDYEIINFILREFIFRNDTISSFFEGEDLYWQENKSSLRDMLIKTLKSLNEAQDPNTVSLATLSKDWEMDKEFFQDLMNVSLQNEEEYEQMVSEKAKNWTVERITPVDIVILRMGIAEMIHFSSIPVKASINEYVDLAKNYGTPKSKEFINGLLDVISVELLAEGKIHKSGRGLIDNR